MHLPPNDKEFYPIKLIGLQNKVFDELAYSCHNLMFRGAGKLEKNLQHLYLLQMQLTLV